MGVLIQIKLILTDFIVFGIWCLNQKKKKSVCMGIDIPGHCKTFPKVCLRYINVICFWVSSEWIIKPMIFFIQLLVWKNSGKRALCLNSYLICFLCAEDKL